LVDKLLRLQAHSLENQYLSILCYLLERGSIVYWPISCHAFAFTGSAQNLYLSRAFLRDNIIFDRLEFLGNRIGRKWRNRLTIVKQELPKK
jgi:hypothetical protein